MSIREISPIKLVTNTLLFYQSFKIQKGSANPAL